MTATLELRPIPDVAPAPVAEPAAAAPQAAPSIADLVKKYIDSGADVSVLTALYLKLRNSKKDLEEQAKKKIAPLNAGMDMIENHFLAKMLEMNVDSLKNEAGTPYKSEKVSITVADNSAFVDYVLDRALQALPVTPEARNAIKNAMIDSGQLALIEARACKSAIEALMGETQELPPGLNHRVEATVNVRAS